MVQFMMCDGVTDGVIARVMGWTVSDVLRIRPARIRTLEQIERQKKRESAGRFAALHVAWEKRRAET